MHAHLRVLSCMCVSEHPTRAFLLDGISSLEERPCCLDYWVCQDCEGNKRGKREWVWLLEVLVWCHTRTKVKAPLQKLCWILKTISSCGSSRNHFITQRPLLLYRCKPPPRTPSPEPRGRHLEASFWSRFSNQRWSSACPESPSVWEAWLHKGSEVDQEAGSLLLLCVRMCVAVYMCVVNHNAGLHMHS